MSNAASSSGRPIAGAHVIIEGDVCEVLRDFADNTFDACFCDPPYLLEFMGKAFDRQHKAMQGANDGQKMQAWHTAWCREVYRVLKPGGFVLAFGGTRTVHRLASAMEDCGFEVRDSLCYLFGAGFPKSLAIDKAIDKAAGAVRQVIGPSTRHTGQSYQWGGEIRHPTHSEEKSRQTAPATDDAMLWQGYGTALKPAHEPLVLAMKPTDGTFAQNALTWGVAGLAIDASRIGTTEKWEGSDQDSGPSIALSGGADGSLNNQRSSSHFAGRWPANVLLAHHEGCREVGTRTVGSGERRQAQPGAQPFNTDRGWDQHSMTRDGATAPDNYGTEEVAAWECHPECPVRMLDEQAGELKSPRAYLRSADVNNENAYGRNAGLKRGGDIQEGYGDTGGPSRFYYTAKVSSRERHLGDINCKHPTLKPLALTEYLSRLLLPPARSGGSLRQLLIPFSGAGSEVAGALRAGWDLVVGIENDAESVQWAEARIAAAVRETETGIREPSKGRRKAAAVETGEQAEVVEPSAEVKPDAECEDAT